MAFRKLAATLVTAGVLVTAAGCGFNPHPDTLQSYAPSDGAGLDINIARNDSVALRNLLILTDGTTYKLYGSIIDNGAAPETVTLQLASDPTATEDFSAAPGQTIGLGYDGGIESTLPLSGKPGDLTAFDVTADGGKHWYKISVPVLDGTIDYYQNLVSGFSTSSPSATPVSTPSPAATN